ncbi:MAG: PAS domain S-box protein [Desulfobacterales bacterium]|nr:PAS domain S-box protein [Desulfobacterales bacterium]
MMIILAIMVFLGACRDTGVRKTVPRISNGVLDLRTWDFRFDGIVTLSGEWRFYWKAHLAPESVFDPAVTHAADLIQVPGTWNGRDQNGEKISGDGFATYRLKILRRPQKERLAFRLLDMGTAFQMYVNGNRLVSSGRPGQTADTTIPFFSPGITEFDVDSDQIDVVVHVSNFHHRSGGMWESIQLGSVLEVRTARETHLVYDFFLLGSILIMGLYHIGLYWVRKDDKTSLYFGIFCLLMGIRLLATGERYILHFVPGMGYEWLNKIIYLSFYGCVPIFVMYAKTLFPQEVSGKINRASQVVALALSLWVLAVPARIYTNTMPGFQLWTLLLFLYGVWAIILSALRKRSGARIFLLGFLALFITTANDILYTRQIIDTGHFFQTGFFIFIFSQAYIISRRFSAAFSTIEKQRLELLAANDDYRKELKYRKHAENDLKESEHKYRLLAENVSDIIWVLNLSTLTFDYISPSVERNRGFTPEEARVLSLEQTLSPESLKHVTEIMQEELLHDQGEGMADNRSRTVEVQHSVKGGGYAWAEVTVSFIRDRDGQPTAIMGVSRDIADRKRAETAIIESEKKYRDLFKNGSDLLCIHDLNGNLLETNLHYKRAYGWTRDDLAGLNIRNMMPDRFKDKFDRYLERVLATGSDEGLMTGYTKSGENVVIEYRNRIITGSDGVPVAVQGAARDVTERIRAEKALRESEEKYKEIVQYAPSGIYEFDMERLRFISVNDVMCQYTGYTETEFLALDAFELLSEESKETLNNLIEEVFSKQPRELAAEYRLRGKDGREFWVLSNARFFYENGVPKRAMAVVHDLTAIRQAEEERRQLEIKLHNAKKLESLGTLAGGVAHDLNNILSGVVSYPDLLLLDLDKDSPLRAPLLTIKKSGERAAEIVQDLLTLARRGVENRKVVSLNQIVGDFLASPEYNKMLAAHHRVRVETNIGENVLNVIGSDVHLSKTLMNLVANAADAMPAGGKVTIATSSCYLDKATSGFESIPEGEYTTLTISDTGIGMRPSDLDQIFEPFYTKKAMGRSGTGLGMSVVWGTIKDHGGFVDIVTEEGSGTTFTLYFPVTRLEKEMLESVYIEDYLGKGESILVIDDSREQRDLAERMMQRLGYTVDTAAGGQEAVAMIKQTAYDLLILDMIMPPGINGLQTYKEILRVVPEQKAVIASGFAETEMVRETQRLGAGLYIKKPYTLEKIGLAVRSELDRQG